MTCAVSHLFFFSSQLIKTLSSSFVEVQNPNFISINYSNLEMKAAEYAEMKSR